MGLWVIKRYIRKGKSEFRELYDKYNEASEIVSDELVNERMNKMLEEGILGK